MGWIRHPRRRAWGRVGLPGPTWNFHDNSKDYAASFAAAAARGNDDPEGPLAEDPLARALSRAAGEFLVLRSGSLRSVIAGYPWFGDWGRDTFISLPGLCLTTGLSELLLRFV